MTNTRIQDLRRTNAGQFDKHTEIPEKLNTEKYGRLNFKYGKICPENKRPNRNLSDQIAILVA